MIDMINFKVYPLFDLIYNGTARDKVTRIQHLGELSLA